MYLLTHDGVLYMLGECEDAYRVRDVFAAPADLGGRLCLRDAELVNELLQRLGSVYRVQVFSLEILDDSELELGQIALAVADDDRDLREADELAGPQTALAGDELVFARQAGVTLNVAAGDRERLEHAVLADALGERL